jgi:hypothetical protein
MQVSTLTLQLQGPGLVQQAKGLYRGVHQDGTAGGMDSQGMSVSNLHAMPCAKLLLHKPTLGVCHAPWPAGACLQSTQQHLLLWQQLMCGRKDAAITCRRLAPGQQQGAVWCKVKRTCTWGCHPA